MPKLLKTAPGLAFLLLLYFGCGAESETPIVKGSTDIEGYRSWPLRRQAVTSNLGHGVSHVYGNDVVSNYLGKEAPAGVTNTVVLRYPVGSIIVKDVFLTNGDLKYVAIMRKPEVVPLGAAEHGGWVWSQRNTSTEIDKFKDAGECLDCHTRANQEHFKDYVFVFPRCEGAVSCVE